MNIDYLMQYLSRQLHTIVRRCTPLGECLKIVCERIGFIDHLEKEPPELLSCLLQAAQNRTYPVILTEGHGIAYAAASAGNDIFLIGPVILMEGTAYRHHIPDLKYASAEWISALHRCTPYFLLKEALLAHNLFREQTISIEEAFEYNCLDQKVKFEVQKDFTDIVFHNQEYMFRHNPYDQEIRELSSIQNGDPQQLSKSWEEDYTGRVGILAKDTLRHCKNLGIVLATLGARAAIAGGVMSEVAFSLSDSYINKIEEATNPETAITLGRQAEYQYALLVRELKNQSADHVDTEIPDSRISRCKDYIFSHLHGKISTSDIAAELYMNPSYLSDLFKKKEGITISEYILQEKLKLVKNMLVYSRYSYSAIANYLGFTSQSYLGAKFKKATGLTLHQYREKYGVKEFDLKGE